MNKSSKLKSSKLNKERAIRRQLDFFIKKNNLITNPSAPSINLKFKIKLFLEHLGIDFNISGKSLKQIMIDLYEDPSFSYLQANYDRPDIKPEVWKKLRIEVLNRDGKKCKICGSENDICIDHILPYSKYPELAIDINNLQPLCRSCNSKKSNKIRI